MQNEFGVQPLDEVLESCSLKNDDLVQASGEQLTHKQVQKARQGRRITPNIRGKIARAKCPLYFLTSQVNRKAFP